MNNFQKIISVLTAILFVITAIVALFAFNFDQRAFKAETYQKAFARDDLYSKVPSMMADLMTSSSADQSQFPIMMHGMSKEAWEAFFRILLPPEALKVMGDDVLSSTFAYLNLQTDSAQLNLAPLKVSLASDTGSQAILLLLKTQPECTFAQIAQMTLNLLSGGQIEFCNPPTDLFPVITPVIQGQMQLIATLIPDQVTIINAPLQNDPRQKLKIARLFMRFSPILPLGFLLALTIFAVRSIRSWLGWWGSSFLITGGFAFVMSLIGAPVFGALLELILVKRIPAYLPSVLLGYASDFAAVMVQTLLSPILWQGLVIAFIGLGMASVAYLLKFTRLAELVKI